MRDLVVLTCSHSHQSLSKPYIRNGTQCVTFLLKYLVMQDAPAVCTASILTKSSEIK